MQHMHTYMRTHTRGKKWNCSSVMRFIKILTHSVGWWWDPGAEQWERYLLSFPAGDVP